MGIFDTIKQGIESLAENAFKSRQDLLNQALQNISDPIAKEISWQPAKSGGSSFKTNNLILNPNGNLEYKISTGAKVFSIIFIIFPIFFLLIGIFTFFLSSSNSDKYLSFLPFLIVPAIFGVIGFFLYKSFNKPIVFDKNIGYFYKGKPKINMGMIDISDKNLIPLSEIYAIQLLSECISGNKSNYYSYELNLVLKDKSRINVVDFGNITAIKQNAQQIGEFLGVPVWDITDI